MRVSAPRIDADRLLRRLAALAEVGARPDGASCRLALTDEDRAGRDLVVSWMRDLGLAVRVDQVGNLVGIRAGTEEAPPVMAGSHIDTVATGGRYDGNYGVLAALEVVAALDERGVATRRPLAVAVFTNEEGVRFQPDMMGSLAWAGGIAVEEALAARAPGGASVGEELARIGYAGPEVPGFLRPHAYVELHVEQGPVLSSEGGRLGAVERLQGISWQEITVLGTANHAGTTPMALRRDAGHAAARIACFVRELCEGAQLGTVGSLELSPGLVNVIAERAVLTVDLRNPVEEDLRAAEARLAAFLPRLAAECGVTIESRRLARTEPVVFDAGIVARIRSAAAALGVPARPMVSGAGHDAQMMARICPAAMIFVPSVGGLSHNPAEHTEPADLALGAEVLLRVLLDLAGEPTR